MRKLPFIPLVTDIFILLYLCRFYFDFSTTFVGAGMICSHLVNLSLLLGAVISFGVMYPLVDRLKGNWFPENLEETNMKGLYGYKVFLSIALILGDGVYTFTKILFSSVLSFHERMKSKNHKNGKSRHKLTLSF
jgi:uncharacterized oligopeptide transporter (OPT) family protein